MNTLVKKTVPYSYYFFILVENDNWWPLDGCGVRFWNNILGICFLNTAWIQSWSTENTRKPGMEFRW